MVRFSASRENGGRKKPSAWQVQGKNTSIATIGKNQITAQKILDRVGYK
jgi:hypothetical protein